MRTTSSVSSKEAARAAEGRRVLVVDDHVFIAELLRNFLKVMPGFTCVGIAGDGKEAIELISAERPDIVVLDLDLPGCGGLEVVQALSKASVETRIIIFSGLSNAEAVRHALQYGVQGFLEKNIQLEDFSAAVNAVAQGDFYVSPAINRSLRTIVQRSLRDPVLDGTDLHILRLFVDGVPPKAIAEEVGMSQSGVYKVVTRLRAKSGAGDDHELRRYAVKLGLVRRAED
ncbi:response regulator transcription factor [Actomonas aquatica]|uniref:Response regulator transcription factor n=1 Tax=Actomonas aquatica TaxID=2866162 RepID=A0ABZ1C420_9BACT|nr:response regulator transcription factor [Opitutus sp. WL0086]WRQ86456.1 response regulator transcription factor [Opitutus sp. WL0086]